MLKVSDYPKSAYSGYFEIVHADDPWLAAGLNVPVGAFVARVYPKSASCVEKHFLDKAEAEAWVVAQMTYLQKEPA